MYVELDNWVEWYVMTKNNWDLYYDEKRRIYIEQSWIEMRIWDTVDML